MNSLFSIFKKKSKNFFPVSTKKVGFSYTDTPVLKDITLNLKEGTITAIIGKSGCGKSTFLKLIAGIISKKHPGNIKIFGMERIFQKHEVGFVPQEIAAIPDLSLLDNIKIAGLNLGLTEKESTQKAASLLKSLKLDENLNKLPTELSGGQRVRLNIILSMLHDPKIIIMDEPFVGLDFPNRRLLWHFLESLKKKGKTVALTSHLLSETQEHVDRLVILKEGKIFFTGKLPALKQKLNIRFIMETRFSFLSKENTKEIQKYCDYRDIKILDSYEKYAMFSIKAPKTRDALLKLFEKLNLMYEIISFREPNLDEIFLKA